MDSALGSFIIERPPGSNQPGRIVRSRRVTVATAASPGDDVRGIAFAPGGKTLYALDLAPPTLVALDLEIRQGRPADQPLWAVEVCSDPSVLRLGFDPWRPGDPTARVAYVVCFRSAQILLVDTTAAQVVGRVASGEGPNTLVLDPAHRRAFITNFADGTIGVIDLDPDHAGFLSMVLQLGVPKRLVLQ
jgi:DNA-binding beta-propeller fold protein YncE